MNESEDNQATDNDPIVEQTQESGRFTEQAKELFDDSVERLDAATLSRLNQGRHAAIEQLALQNTRTAAQWLRWMPATGVAAAALVAVLLFRGPGVDQVPVAHAVADFEILLEDESLEMLEDLEFYSWLELADVDTNGNVG